MKELRKEQKTRILQLLESLTKGVVRKLPPPAGTGLLIAQELANETIHRRGKVAEGNIFELSKIVKNTCIQDLHTMEIDQAIIAWFQLKYELSIIAATLCAGHTQANLQWTGELSGAIFRGKRL